MGREGIQVAPGEMAVGGPGVGTPLRDSAGICIRFQGKLITTEFLGFYISDFIVKKFLIQGRFA
jgi:hypothetical protein